MAKVQRSEILDYQTYDDIRAATRARILDVKRPRRIHVGEHLTFLFENHDTIWYQIQEMVRAERIVREADIQHEIDTYNALLGEPGELGCCLLVEVDDVAARDRRLREWRALPGHIYVRCADGHLARAAFDAAQMNADKISAVQYLKFQLGDRQPVAVGCDLPALAGETTLDDEQRAALAIDLGGILN